jgi:hypothetical protein
MPTHPKLLALATVLMLQASPARSETIDVACTTTAGHSARLLIDTDAKTVVLTSDGASTRYATTVLSEQFIKFGAKRPYDQISQEMTIDRVAGTLLLEQTYQGMPHGSLRYSCQRTARKL